MFSYHHVRCGRLVFTYPTRLEDGDKVEPHLALVEGRPAVTGQPLVCKGCGNQSLRFDYSFLEVRDAAVS